MERKRSGRRGEAAKCHAGWMKLNCANAFSSLLEVRVDASFAKSTDFSPPLLTCGREREREGERERVGLLLRHSGTCPTRSPPLPQDACPSLRILIVFACFEQSRTFPACYKSITGERSGWSNSAGNRSNIAADAHSTGGRDSKCGCL